MHRKLCSIYLLRCLLWYYHVWQAEKNRITEKMNCTIICWITSLISDKVCINWQLANLKRVKKYTKNEWFHITWCVWVLETYTEPWVWFGRSELDWLCWRSRSGRWPDCRWAGGWEAALVTHHAVKTPASMRSARLCCSVVHTQTWRII